ncbi:FCD domain-containing protein [Rhizobiales bacterium RZME27]|uniref:FCD domain-containing protein n=1 Tax=Endobacterium cereale TaxID=2663029 RepID=A0A6A8A824_9HYPH|nr:FadR/GntR family transcriptional regulator [Endobacterium cereale]MEB2847170.1 FadR/GntR family transcriptional regulator [Endobacterium cereale]MQY47415.1 FCD domain-containing protein [Endobacterium cereale]
MDHFDLRPRDTLAERIESQLRGAIAGGTFQVGDKLPSEAQLTEAFCASRTVVRQALAALRRAGLVEARQGAGVFVVAHTPPAASKPAIEHLHLASSLEILEIRTPVEIAAAGLAAARRSPAQEEQLFELHAEFLTCMRDGTPAREADYHLHLAIAQAAGNPQFVRFLREFGQATIPRVKIVPENNGEAQRKYLELLATEHNAVILAISQRDPQAAEEAMRRHLHGSQMRHRALLQEGAGELPRIPAR